jgi:hypothetical protein
LRPDKRGRLCVCWLFIFKVTEPSSIPYRTHPACAKRAAYPDPPPVICRAPGTKISFSISDSSCHQFGTNRWHHHLSSVFIYLTNSPFGLHVYHLHWVSSLGGRENSTKDLEKDLFVLSILASRAVPFLRHAREGLYKTSCEFVKYKSRLPFCNRQI